MSHLVMKGGKVHLVMYTTEPEIQSILVKKIVFKIDTLLEILFFKQNY